MRQVLSVIVSSAAFAFSLFSATSFAGDCNKTVMGGGCTGQVEAGVSPHMQSQNPLNTATKAKVKVNAAVPAVKTTTVAKPVTVSTAAQKPQI